MTQYYDVPGLYHEYYAFMFTHLNFSIAKFTHDPSFGWKCNTLQ